MTQEDINFARLNYLISLDLSKNSLAKRMHRAKTNPKKKDEYIILCIVKGLQNFEGMVYSERSE